MNSTTVINPMSSVEIAYIELAHILNTSDSVSEIINSLNNALISLRKFINTGLPTNNYMVYNILLIAKLFIKSNKEKYCFSESFMNLERLMKLFEYSENIEKNTPKR